MNEIFYTFFVVVKPMTREEINDYKDRAQLRRDNERLQADEEALKQITFDRAQRIRRVFPRPEAKRNSHPEVERN